VKLAAFAVVLLPVSIPLDLNALKVCRLAARYRVLTVDGAAAATGERHGSERLTRLTR